MFIGSGFLEALVHREAMIRVLDNLSIGRREKTQKHVKSGALEFVQEDLVFGLDVLRRSAGGQVGDITSRTIGAAKVIDGTPVHLGTMERTRVTEATNELLRYTGQKALFGDACGADEPCRRQFLGSHLVRVGTKNEVHERLASYHWLRLAN
jgi:hypothetical protein